MELRGKWIRCVVLALGGVIALAVGTAGCGSGGKASVGPGVIFNNVIAADLGGELKIAFADYSRAPAMEHPREAEENFMITLHPVWSPDGEKLAFTRTVEGEEEALFVRESLGHPEAEAEEIGPATGKPVWSPASDRIAYLAMTSPAAEAEGEGGEEKAPEASEADDAGGLDEAQASSEGSAESEASEGSGEGGGSEEKKAPEEPEPVGLTVVGDDGSNPRLLVRGEADPIGWSDEAVYYVAGIYGMRSLRAINADGKKDRGVYAASGSGRFVGEAALSPDGDRVAIEVVSPDESSVLVVKELRGGRAVQVTRSGSIAGLSWSPNGKQVAFVLAPSAGSPGRVMRWAVGSGAAVPVTAEGGKYRCPSWTSEGNALAYVKDGDIYVQRIGSKKADRLTKSGDAADIACSPK